MLGSDLGRNRRRKCLRYRSFRAPTTRCCWPSYRNRGTVHRIAQKTLQGLGGALGARSPPPQTPHERHEGLLAAV